MFYSKINFVGKTSHKSTYVPFVILWVSWLKLLRYFVVKSNYKSSSDVSFLLFVEFLPRLPPYRYWYTNLTIPSTLFINTFSICSFQNQISLLQLTDKRFSRAHPQFSENEITGRNSTVNLLSPTYHSIITFPHPWSSIWPAWRHVDHASLHTKQII